LERTSPNANSNCNTVSGNNCLDRDSFAVRLGKHRRHINTNLEGRYRRLLLVEALPTGAKVLGLTNEAIQTDVELKLRLAGMRVVTESESFNEPGGPYIYVNLSLTDNAIAAHIDLNLAQNAQLERNNEFCVADTWHRGLTASNPTAQVIRNAIKDLGRHAVGCRLCNYDRAIPCWPSDDSTEWL
jgi:hypothetical protein